MNGVIMTPKDLTREFVQRLSRGERATQALEVRRRLRTRRQLRRAIEEVIRLDGGTQEVAREFLTLLHRVDRPAERPCC